MMSFLLVPLVVPSRIMPPPPVVDVLVAGVYDVGDPEVARRLRTFVPNGIALVTEANVLAGNVAEDPD